MTPQLGNGFNASTPALPGTPLASADLGHTAAEEEAARVCQVCQSLHCVCGRGGGTGEGGFSEPSGSTATAAWYSTSPSPTQQQQQQQLMYQLLNVPAAAAAAAIVPLSLVPPFRAARVENGVHRGAYPVLRNFPYLRRLRLRTIVSLIPEPPTYDLKCFAEAEHIQLHHIHAERAKGEVQLLPSELGEALQLLMNVDLHPLYVHCLDGRHVTGLVVMGLRKLQQWDIKAAHAEYLRFTGEEQDEVAFIADYTGPLLVPPHLPPWLWGGSLYDPATGQAKKLQPSSMRFKLSTTVTGGVASPTSSTTSAGFPNIPGPTAFGAVAGDGGAGFQGRGGAAAAAAAAAAAGALSVDNVRPHAAVPWMSVPNAELIAADGQHYVDVDRVREAAAIYCNPRASYSSVPVLFSFEYATANTKSSNSSSVAHAGSTQASARRGGSATQSAGSAPPLQLPLTNTSIATALSHLHSSHLSSQSSSANGSIVGAPIAAAAVLASARGAGAQQRSPSPSTRRGMVTSPLEHLAHYNQQQQQHYHHHHHAQPPSPNASAASAATVSPSHSQQKQEQRRGSPTPSNGSNSTTETFTGGLFDGHFSALMWTSGLTAPQPAVIAPHSRKSGVSGGSSAAAAAAGVGGGGVGIGASTGSVSGQGGVSSSVGASGPVGVGNAATSGSRRAGGAGSGTGGSGAGNAASKRSFSR